MPNLNHKLVIGLLDRLETELPIERRPAMYAAGLSMGGFGTWDLLIRNPKRFAAGVVICGGGTCREVIVAKDVPLWLFHGARTRPSAWSGREIVETLKKIGATPQYTESTRTSPATTGTRALRPRALRVAVHAEANRRA